MTDREAGRSAPTDQFLVVFDVASDLRRRRLVRVLLAYGKRVQFSAFECRMRPTDEPRFRALVAQHIEPAEDRLAVYPMCGSCRGRVTWLGEPLERTEDDDWILV